MPLDDDLEFLFELKNRSIENNKSEEAKEEVEDEDD